MTVEERDYPMKFVFNNTNQESPWSRISAAININRIATFDQQAFLSGTNMGDVIFPINFLILIILTPFFVIC